MAASYAGVGWVELQNHAVGAVPFFFRGKTAFSGDTGHCKKQKPESFFTKMIAFRCFLECFLVFQILDDAIATPNGHF